VPTATFRVIEHPTGGWIIQQLREALPFDTAPRYLIFDNAKKYGADVLSVIEHMDIRRKQIKPYSAWQNGAAERWVATMRRDLLDHVIVLNERHLHRLLSEFVAYYHAERNHQGLDNAIIAPLPSPTRAFGRVRCRERLGGMLRYYDREAG